MRERNFNKELLFFLNKIKDNTHFSLSRWGDGELMILENKPIDLRNVKNGEFRFDPNIRLYNKSKELLDSSYKYVDENYYVGIACPCCVGQKKYEYMKKLSGQKEENLTWANLFVNSNYNSFLQNYVKEFKDHKIVMIVNKQADITKLPFDVEETYYVGTDAWYENLDLIQNLKLNIDEYNKNNYIFLIGAGPLANIITAELWKHNKNNTYIDIGSVFDTQMGMKPTRGYHMGAPTLKKICKW